MQSHIIQPDVNSNYLQLFTNDVKVDLPWAEYVQAGHHIKRTMADYIG